MKAKAAVFQKANQPFVVQEFDITKTPSGYARMDLIASGVCGTDVHFHKGRLPIAGPTIIGHEFVGKIADMNPINGDDYGLKVGDNVIADIAVPCGKCLLCKTGDEANCVHMGVTNGGDIHVAPYLYGGYAEVNYTPLTNLVKIPENVDPTEACVFACPGPTALHAFALAKRAGVESKDIHSAVIQGLGPVGMFALIYLKALGVERVFAIHAGENTKREEQAKAFGVKAIFNLSHQSADEIDAILKQENDGLGVDLVFEASGAPQAMVQGMDILRNRGVYLVPGQYSNSGGVTIQPQLITFKALRILGSSQYTISDVKDYLAFLSRHPEYRERILNMANFYPISKVNQAFADAEAGRNGKTVLVKG